VGTTYEAISYCWGESSQWTSITVDDKQCRITLSLAEALQHVRFANEERTLWIDQICINQNDLKERSEQVQMMSRIYQLAHRVLVWLGPAKSNSMIGMHALAYFCRYIQDTRPASWLTLPGDLLAPGIDDILTRAWFERSWVVQEAAVAREVQLICGSHSVSWPNLSYRVQSFIKQVKLAVISPQWASFGIHADGSNLIRVLSMQLEANLNEFGPEGPDSRQTLLDIVYELRNHHSKDLRDKIYSALGLVSKEEKEKFIVDYSMTVEEVYRHLEQVTLGTSAAVPRSGNAIEEGKDAMERVVQTSSEAA
jgi:hypothetical protein